MIYTHFNIFDVTVIGIMLLSCLFAFFRGFVREVLSLGAWIGAGIVTLYYFPQVSSMLQPNFKNPIMAAGIGTLGTYFLALMGFSLLNMLIMKFVKSGSEVGMLDNLFGLMFGALRGAFIISLGYLVLIIILPEEEEPEWLKAAKTRSYVEEGAIVLAKATPPQYLQEIPLLQKKIEESLYKDQYRVEEPSAGGEDSDSGYSHKSNSQMQRLIDSTNTE